MRHQTIPTPQLEVGQRRASPGSKRGRRFLLIAVALSVAVHLVAALLVVALPRILPKEAKPQEQGAVELLMVEQKGTEPSPGAQPKADTPPPQAAEKSTPPKPAAPKTEAAPPVVVPPPKPPEQAQAPTPALPDQADPKATELTPPQEAAPPPPMPKHTEAPQPAPAEPKEAEARPMPPRPQEAPVFDLGGTDSESNATALGGHILPAMKDDRFRNRPPVYPLEAAVHGESGTVSILIHVSENGTASSVDIMESSGFSSLDQAAIRAVEKWHFRPALQEGQPVPFDMPFQIIFNAN